MASTYISEFMGSNKNMALNVIDDMCSGKSLTHYKNRFVAEEMKDNPRVDWRKRYVSSNYMDVMLKTYIDYVQVLRNTTDTSLGSSLPAKTKKVLDVFYNKNNWNSLFKTLASNRKKFGDVYIYWYIAVDKESGVTYPRLKILESKNIEIMINEDEDIFAYVYEKTVKYKKEIGSKTGVFENRSKVVKWIFKEGSVDIYEDGVYIKSVMNKKEYENIIPIVHLQFLKEDYTPYSVVPFENLIDLSLDLDRIETDIALINTLMGAPQVYVVDGEIAENSGFGPNSVIYVDSTRLESTFEKSYQAKFGQLEITNDLKSLYQEKGEKVDLMYNRSNLISPKDFLVLAQSDSSKVVSAARKDLEQELKSLYLEIINKFSVLFTVLYKDNGIKVGKDKKITLELPEYIIDETVYDKYLLKAQKMNLGELTIKENLRSMGYSKEEIKAHMNELNEEQIFGNNDISSSGGMKSMGTDNQSKQVNNL